MVRLAFHKDFEKAIKRIRDSNLKLKIRKQLVKIRENPEVGKPMRNVRKGTREVYISPFRLSYKYVAQEDTIMVLDLYHKNKQ